MSQLLVSAVLLLGLLVSGTPTAHAQLPSGTNCSLPRIRKSWSAYTDQEKTLYKNALQLAMTRGYQTKFVEMHVETKSELEAHGNCMFIYWHRMYLLGYENMLRSLGPGFECVTLPVWDHIAATANRSGGGCMGMEGCAPIITDFGGSTKGLKKSINVGGYIVPTAATSVCVNSGLPASFCGNGTQCGIIRNNSVTATYPAEAEFASVAQQVFTYSTWYNFAISVERGVHNTVHSKLGGIMMYLQSPVDPLFHAHHGFIDALQTIYVNCQLSRDSVQLSRERKASDPRFWTSCARRGSSNANFSVTDEIYMAVRDFSNTASVHVRTNASNTLHAFFKDLPPRFVDYIDTEDLGNYSYAYNFSGGLAKLYTNCSASTSLETAATTVLMASTDDEIQVTTNRMPRKPRTIVHESNSIEKRTQLWTIALYESARLNGYTDTAASEQMEMMACLHKHECYGPVADFDPVFRENFHVEGHPRCFTLVEALKKGGKIIGVPGWRQISSRFVPCPNKESEKKSSRPTAYKE